MDEAALKQLVKTAVVEVMEERPDLWAKIFESVFEDIAMARAIEEGLQSPLVDRETVMKTLSDES